MGHVVIVIYEDGYNNRVFISSALISFFFSGFRLQIIENEKRVNGGGDERAGGAGVVVIEYWFERCLEDGRDPIESAEAAPVESRADDDRALVFFRRF